MLQSQNIHARPSSATATSGEDGEALISVIGDRTEGYRFVGTQAGQSITLEELSHPWHIQISDDLANNPELYQKLVKMHIAGDIQVGDKITGIWQANLCNICYIAKIFDDEYEVLTESAASKAGQKTVVRVPGNIGANIHTELPASPNELKSEFEQYGHIIVRPGKVIEEEKILEIFGPHELIDYRYGNTERKQIQGSRALNVTAWPEELMIPAHSEMTYHLEFPKLVVFICKETSQYGGETSIYDCARAYQNLPSELKAKIQNRDALCCKRYVKSKQHHRYPSWCQVLGANASAEDAIEHFHLLGYSCEKFQEEEPDGCVTVVETRLQRPMVYRYRNMLCLHASMVALTPYWYDQLWPDDAPPLIAVWDDGTAISQEEFYMLHDAMLSARISYGGWQQHDILILDNPRMAHGRLPFIGRRQIGVLMAQSLSFSSTKTKAGQRWCVNL